MPYEIKKIFLILFGILTISCSQNIFATDEGDYTLSESTLLYENSYVDSGLIIILGKRMEFDLDNDHLKKLKIFDIDLKRDMEAAHAARSVNILYINLHNSESNLTDIGKAIKEFSKKNKEISIISMIHGAVIFPGASHTINVGPEAPDSFIYNLVGSVSPDASRYLAGYFVPSSEFFKVISDAVGNKPIKMWQCSCQGNKTIEDAKKILPENSIFVTETKGWAGTSPVFLFHALSRTLRSGVAFDFHTLLVNYAYESNLFTNKFRGDADYCDDYGCTYEYNGNYYAYPGYVDDGEYKPYHDRLFNINPIYTVIGKKSISLVDAADEFLKKYRSNQIDNKKILQVLSKLCNLIIPLDDNFLETCITSGEQELKEVADRNAFVKECTTHNGEKSYITDSLINISRSLLNKNLSVEFLYKWLPGWLWNAYHNPQCKLDYVRYMFLISIGAVIVKEKLIE